MDIFFFDFPANFHVCLFEHLLDFRGEQPYVVDNLFHNRILCLLVWFNKPDASWGPYRVPAAHADNIITVVNDRVLWCLVQLLIAKDALKKNDTVRLLKELIVRIITGQMFKFWVVVAQLIFPFLFIIATYIFGRIIPLVTGVKNLKRFLLCLFFLLLLNWLLGFKFLFLNQGWLLSFQLHHWLKKLSSIVLAIFVTGNDFNIIISKFLGHPWYCGCWNFNPNVYLQHHTIISGLREL